MGSSSGSLLSGLQVGGNLMEAYAAREHYKAQSKQIELQSKEITRQAGITNYVAFEKASDRVQSAYRDWSRLAAALIPQGATGTLRQLTNEVNFLEGTDLGRINRERINEIAGLRAEAKGLKIAAKANATAHRFAQLGRAFGVLGDIQTQQMDTQFRADQLAAARGTSSTTRIVSTSSSGGGRTSGGGADVALSYALSPLM